MSKTVTPTLITELEKITNPSELFRTVFDRFKDRAAIGTSGQLTGSVMIDMACQTGLKPRVFTIDTLKLFPETYSLFEAVEKKYDIQVEKIRPPELPLQKMIAEHGEYLFFDTKEKQELCCHIRKVLPNDEVLKGLDVWFTGLRSDQSKARSSTSRFEIIQHPQDQHPILKIAPLVDWNEKQIWDYIKAHNVPTHPLLTFNQDGWYYESLGCVICTTPIGPHEPRRAGRWRWFNALDPSSKECGLHERHVKKDEI